jgi:TolA-binding protein
MTDDLLRDLAKDLPHDRPDPARRDAVRASLLAQVEDDVRPAPLPGRRWLVVGGAFAAGALAAAALALLLVRDDRPLTPNPAQITASSEARLEHRVVATSTGADEIVHVHTGTVKVAVATPRRGDRSLVRTRDAEVEGVGEYEVIVADETLRAVTVRSGSAQIKVADQRAVFLAAGQTWKASVITTDLSPSPSSPSTRVAVASDLVPSTPSPRSDTVHSPTPAPRAPRSTTPAPRSDPAPRNDPAPQKDLERTAPAQSELAPDTRDIRATDSPQPMPPTAAPRTTSEIEKRFQAGWALLKQGKAKEAAVELGAAADAAPSDPLAVDARYFQAVAFVRAGQRADAERVLAAFLDRSPRSLRRGRAAVLLGRLLGERGDRAAAQKWLESAVGDPDPAIAAAARAGIETLAAKR